MKTNFVRFTAATVAIGFARWANGNIAWRSNTSGQGAGKEAALSAAAQSWTNVTSANHVVTNAGSNCDFQATCAHELGHALGIHHTELTGTPRPTMYAAYFGTDGRTLESDDAAALQCAQSRYPIP